MNYIQQGIGQYGYLYFRVEVLQKFLTSPGYSVFFHMRNWGTANLSGERGSIDVGINSQGLVNAFAPDIAKLTPAEQAYWSSFSSLPSGEICEDMFQTRMQLAPPNSPGIVDLVQESRASLNSIFEERFSLPLVNDWEPSYQELSRLSVGPISNQYTEVLDLTKILYGWIIETMRIGNLRDVLDSLGGNVDQNLRQIKLLERIGSAHIGSPALKSAFELLGSSIVPLTPREGWNLCADSIVNCLKAMTKKFAE
jgi:hypothetical protein